MNNEKSLENTKTPLNNSDDDPDNCSPSCLDDRDIDQGWAWVVMVASFASNCLIGGTMYGVGIIHTTLLEMFGESIALTSWAGALHSAMMSAGGPLSSFLIDRFSCRVAIMASGVLYVIGYLGTAFAPNIQVAIFTCGIISGVGGGCGYTACTIVVGFSFSRWRNVALGVALSGIGVGVFAMAPLMQFSHQYFGGIGFFFVIAALTAHLVTLGALFFPSRLEIRAQKKRKRDANILKSSETKTHCAPLQTYKHVALNRAVICLCLCMFNYCLGTFLVFLHLPSYIISVAFSPSQAAYILSICGIMSVVGRIITGTLSGWVRLDAIVFYSGSMAVVGMATILYPFYNSSLVGNIIYAALLGLFFGNCYIMTTPVNIKHVGINYMASAIGLQYFYGGIGAIIGPVLAGYITDTGGTYQQSFIVAGCCILLAALFSAMTAFMAPGKCLHPSKAEKTMEAELPMVDMELVIDSDIK